jgi:acetaldehyde dehydrogenase
VHRMVAAVQDYVPGYRLLQEPQFDDPSPATRGATKVSVFIEVEGAGDFLPPYSGNLDIMTAAATRAGEGMARHRPDVEPVETQPVDPSTGSGTGKDI